MTIDRLSLAAASLALLAAGLCLPHPGLAQEMTSREVVQPLPTQEVQRLNRALVDLAKRPRDIDALVEAGTAALEVGDLDGAVGFFGRARELEPDDADVALGLARVYLRSGRASDALVQFARALSGGIAARELLTDQALAFDLVGDQPSAQAAYSRALQLNPEDHEARRRLAISHAIVGNRPGFEDALRPLLDSRDMGAFRARAFGLAIFGDQQRAAAIVEQVMPRDLAGRLVPYLAYMPRLTRPQQAAAANLGIFPRAAEIGRDDPRLARFTNESRADRRLEPAGEPLGRGGQTSPSGASPVVGPVASAPAAAATTRVEDAFADLGSGALPDARVSGNAVDIARIAVPREVLAKPATREPQKPLHPARVWVQLATGRDRGALGFDWRRISRNGGDLLARMKPYTTPWGEAHRLLAGPLDTRDKAQELVRALKAKGLDSFVYSSPEGEQIQPVA